MSRYSALRRLIVNTRNETFPRLGPNPENLKDINLNQLLRVTEKGDPFLFYDLGKEDPNRILVFTTDRNLQLLNEIEHWHVDETFEIAPEIFYQIFNINGIFKSIIFYFYILTF